MELTAQVEGDILRAQFSGPAEIPFLLESLPGLIDRCQKEKLDLLLLDFLGVELRHITTLERYRLGTALLATTGKVRKVASVSKPELIDPQRLGETVAQNRGVNFRAFTDAKAACEWLKA